MTNNVVITSACHGITFASIHNSLIADNTVVEDGLVFDARLRRRHQRWRRHARRSVKHQHRRTEQSYQPAQHRHSRYRRCRRITMSPCVAARGRSCRGTSTASSNIFSQPGTYTNGNIIDTGGTKGEFVNFNPAALTYTVMLKSGAAGHWRGNRGSADHRHPRRHAHGSVRCGSVFVSVLKACKPGHFALISPYP